MQLFFINKPIHYTRDTFNSFMGQIVDTCHVCVGLQDPIRHHEVLLWILHMYD